MTHIFIFLATFSIQSFCYGSSDADKKLLRSMRSHDFDRGRPDSDSLRSFREAGEALANGANPNMVDWYYGPILLKACNLHREDLVQLLVDHQADINAKSISGSTPLMHAFQPDITKFLIGKKADINMQDSSGKTVFERLICSEGAAKILLRARPDICLKDKEGKSLIERIRAVRRVEYEGRIKRNFFWMEHISVAKNTIAEIEEFEKAEKVAKIKDCLSMFYLDVFELVMNYYGCP